VSDSAQLASLRVSVERAPTKAGRARVRLLGSLSFDDAGYVWKALKDLSPSTMKSMEEAVMRALDKFPLVVEKVLSVAERADAVLLEVHGAELPQRTAGLLASATRSVDAFERKLNAIDGAGLSQHAHQALGELNQVLDRADKLMARIDSEAGLIDSVQRASDSIGDVASNARGTGPKLDQTLEQVSEMADSMQRLLDALERDPDMLLKGHARSLE
jgi:phospholipid/cholesterol/gamma-HCH transport system substrate-binding protein